MDTYKMCNYFLYGFILIIDVQLRLEIESNNN